MRLAALDDDASQLDLIQSVVRAMGHECHCFESGEALLHELRRDSFDLLILDWELPDLDGPAVTRWVRSQRDPSLPILFLTNRCTERDIVEGLGCGADDYMVKPLRVHELKARVNALLRRAYPPASDAELRCGAYRIDAGARTLSWGDEAIELKHKEFDLARCLFANPGRLLSRAYLTETVWGRAVEVPSRSLDTHISTLRSKLQLRPERGFRLASVYGQGYRLEAL